MRALALASLALAACADPTLTIEVGYAPDDPLDGYLHPAGGAPPAYRLSLRAIDAELAAGTACSDTLTSDCWPRAAGVTGPATCRDVALARVPVDVLDTATVASVEDGHGLLGVPRLGKKLIVVEALAPRGRRLGFGCAAVGDVDEDERVPVVLSAAARAVRLRTADAVALRLTTAWDEDVPLVRDVELDRYDRTGRLANDGVDLDVDAASPGRVTITGLDAGTATGPAEALIRVAGAPDVTRVGLWRDWPRVLTGTDEPRVEVASAPGTRTSGSVGLLNLGPAVGTHWCVASSYLADDGARTPTLKVVCGLAGRLRVLEQPSDPGAPLVIDGRLWLITDDGWRPVQPQGSPVPTGFTLGPAQADPRGGAAVDAAVVPGCGGQPPFLLVRREPGAPYLAYRNVAVASTEQDALLGVIGGGRYRSQLCIRVDEGALQSLVLYDAADDGGLRAVKRDGGEAPLAGVAALTELAGGARGLAAIETSTGPRARSFRFATLDQATVAIPTDAIDVPLAAPPVDLLAATLDLDTNLDLITVAPIAGGLQLQAILDDVIAGAPVSAVSGVLAAPPGPAGRARLLVVDADGAPGDPRDEVVIITDTTLDVFAP